MRRRPPGPSRWQRATAFQLAVRWHKVQLRELREVLPPDEYAAVLDIFERMQQHERHRLTRWEHAA